MTATGEDGGAPACPVPSLPFVENFDEDRSSREAETPARPLPIPDDLESAVAWLFGSGSRDANRAIPGEVAARLDEAARRSRLGREETAAWTRFEHWARHRFASHLLSPPLRTLPEGEAYAAALDAFEKEVRKDNGGLGRAAVALQDPAANAASKSLDVRRAVDRLREVLVFEATSDYLLFLLIAAETHLIDLLDSLVNLGIRGPVGAGKSTAGHVFAFLGDRVELASSVTPAYLPHLTAMSNGIVVDRIDRRLKSDDGAMLAQLLDAGYERDLPYRKMEPDPSGRWRPVKLPVFGVRILGYVDDLAKEHGSTASRTPEIRMVPALTGAVRRRARRYYRHLAPVALWLRSECERARGRWSRDDVERLEESPEFVAFSDSLDESLSPERDGEDRAAQLAENLWLIAQLLGWDVEDGLREVLTLAGERRGAAESSARQEAGWPEEIRAALADFLATQTQLNRDGAVMVVPANWVLRTPLVSLLAWVGRHARLPMRGNSVSARAKTAVYTELRRVGAYRPGRKVSVSHDGGDQRVGAWFDCATLRRLGVPFRSDQQGGAGDVP